MLKLLFILIICCSISVGFAQDWLISPENNAQYEENIALKEYKLSANDTLAYDIKLVFNKDDNPRFYYTKLVTPVCETGVCKLVAIKVYWDLTGGYLRYELPPDKILTKIDHQPFDEKDYEKLDKILLDSYWPLAEYEIDELIIDSTKTLIDIEIDAYSGATAKFVSKDDNIEGALYTIYTLWKFVHDEEKVSGLQDVTAELMDQNKLQLIDFLKSSNQNYQRWAVDILSSKDSVDEKYYQPLLNIILNADQFMAYDALQLLGLTDVHLQNELWEIYKKVNIFKKRDIIDKFSNVQLDLPLFRNMVLYLSRINSYPEARLLIQLISTNLSDELVQTIRKINEYENERVGQEIKALR